MLPAGNGWKLRHFGSKVFCFFYCWSEVAETEGVRLIVTRRQDKHSLDISTYEVIRSLHGDGKVFLVVVEKPSVRDNDQRYLITQRCED